ncbi:MAG: tRNA (adenosine(37)-N6)-dimethylallyltransferase MiaA [Alphaproteobacteria bacterium]|nr:tRNA (adenosine(37)-N6)-dimethylallyltransferase MiaA [Alphaproteobacteria bacterium]
MPDASPKPIVVAGPTASGKSALALALARRLGGVVINADSMQVYAELRVLTARPSADEEAAAPHRLYGVLSVRERCSAGRWRTMALAALAQAQREGRRPIFVGGTGLYLRALLEGIAEIPDIPEAARRDAEALHAAIGGSALRARLAQRDPETAARLADGDRQRLVRAFAVLEATGRPLAAYQAAQARDGGVVADVILLAPPRALLCERIDRRCAAMLAQGALDEVAVLAAMALDPGLPAMKAVGVPGLLRYLAGAIGADEALRLFQTATRQYAKRQDTWFRHQLKPDLRLEAQYSESLEAEIFRFISKER